jgi:hypothetical protein
MLEGCSSFFSCTENLIILGFSLYLTYKLIKSYKTVLKDRNKILSVPEIHLIRCGIVQNILILLYFSFFAFSFIFFLLRFFRIAQETILLSFMLQLTTYRPDSEKILTGSFLINILLFLWALLMTSGEL